MARPRKTGLDYFPMDVSFLDSDVMVAVAGKHGSVGVHLLLRVLCSIYRNGYYIPFDELFILRMTREVGGMDDGGVREFVNDLVKWGFFDGGMFTEYGVLTSVAIQNQYFNIVNRNSRDNGAEKPYLLVENLGKSGVSREFSDGKPTENGGNKSKEKKSKEKVNNTFSGEKDIDLEKPSPVGDVKKNAPQPEKERFVKPTIEQVEEYVKEKGYEFDPETFIAHYEANGWKVNRAPMKSWKSACTTWQKYLEADRRKEAERLARYGASRASPPPKEQLKSPIPDYTDEEWNRLTLWQQDEAVHKHYGI